jgi:hypothetical protein
MSAGGGATAQLASAVGDEDDSAPSAAHPEPDETTLCVRILADAAVLLVGVFVQPTPHVVHMSRCPSTVADYTPPRDARKPRSSTTMYCDNAM